MFFSEKKPLHRTIGLVTDFGLSDPYVGQMKGVLARLAPLCPVVDISHGVAPFNVAQAAFFLAASEPHMPKDAVLLAVVDPGVGTGRKIVGVQRGERLFLAPDNGLLGFLLERGDEEFRTYDLTAAQEAAGEISNTFHGRDVFAPLAAWLAMGGRPENLGREIAPGDILRRDWTRPTVSETEATATVLHVDRFGNCVLNLRPGRFAPDRPVRVAGSDTVLRPAEAYAQLGEGAPGILAGSQGFMEIAVNLGSAHERFGLNLGDTMVLTTEGT